MAGLWEQILKVLNAKEEIPDDRPLFDVIEEDIRNHPRRQDVRDSVNPVFRKERERLEVPLEYPGFPAHPDLLQKKPWPYYPGWPASPEWLDHHESKPYDAYPSLMRKNLERGLPPDFMNW